jgi:hypothetical protein
MELICEVEPRTNYGTTHLYPINAVAKLFARLVGRKTLTMDELRVIAALGYTIKETVPHKINLGELA